MDRLKRDTAQRVLIASGNPLFGRGLERLITKNWRNRLVEIRHASSTADSLSIMDAWQPDLVIVDYDDVKINRAEFLQNFVAGDQPMQVMLVSLQATGAVVVYDRRTLTPAQAEDWLNLSWLSQPEESSEKTERSSSMRHFVLAGIMVAITTAIVYFLLISIGVLPEAASVEAGPIDQLFSAHFAVIAFLFSLITVLVSYSIIVFRKRKGQDDDGPPIKGSGRLEIFWTVIPLITVLSFSYIGSVVLGEVRQADPGALTVEVIGRQWSFEYRYPDFGVTSSDLYVPEGREVLLRMWSEDVIHSFWVPEFRVKQDLLPNPEFTRELRFTATKTGEYQVLCAEMCGLRHATMVNSAFVLAPEDFDNWVNEQTQIANADPATRGEQWAENSGCMSCHSIDGSEKVGPTWLGLFGSERTLEDGSTVVVDDRYLHTAIVDPNAQIPEGFPPNVMPQNYEDTLSQEQIADMVEFIESLGSGEEN